MAVHTSSCSCHPGIPPLDDARFAGRGRVTSPAVCSAGQLPALNVSLIWRSATQSSEPLNPNTRLHFGNLTERGVQNGGSAKTAQFVRRPPGNLGQRALSHSAITGQCQPVHIKEGLPAETDLGASVTWTMSHACQSLRPRGSGLCRSCARGGGQRRLGAQISGRDLGPRRGCVRARRGVLALSVTRPRLHDSVPMSSPVHANPLPDRTIAARTSDCPSWPSANIELMLLLVVAVAVAQRIR